MPVFPKRARITKPKEFDFLFNEGRRRNGRYFALCWKEGEKRRLGIAVSRKIKRATQKNRIKRVVRELFRLQPEIFPKGDLIVIAKLGVDALTNEEIRGTLNAFLCN